MRPTRNDDPTVGIPGGDEITRHPATTSACAMSEDAKAMAALIVHKQVEFGRLFARTRSTVFASTVVDRFFIDNSLGRQRRLIESTKRRQARALEKALKQKQELERLQQEYEHRRQLQRVQSARGTSRMTRKLQHVAAVYIQHVFRCFRQRRQLRQHAFHVITSCVFKWWVGNREIKRCASARIQCWWRRRAVARKMLKLQRIITSLIDERRHNQHCSAKRIQRRFLHWRYARRCWAAIVVQRAWHCHRFRQKLLQAATEFRDQQTRVRRDADARILQRALGKNAARRRLLRSAALARFSQLREWRCRCRATPYQSSLDNQTQKRLLSGAAARGRHLRQLESKLRCDAQELAEALRQSRESLGEERERLRRFHAWAELRKTKEDELLREQLSEWESRRRFEIRLELERELQLERRAQEPRVAEIRPRRGVEVG